MTNTGWDKQNRKDAVDRALDLSRHTSDDIEKVLENAGKIEKFIKEGKQE